MNPVTSPNRSLLNQVPTEPVRISQTAQALFGRISPRPAGTDLLSNLRGRVRRAMLRSIHLQGLPIRYELHDTPLLMPLAHSLPTYRATYCDYGENLGRVARRVIGKYPSGTIIDIGANVGDSAVIIRHHAGPVPTLCIEPSDDYYPYLQSNSGAIGSQITCIKVAVDASSGVIRGRLSSADGSARILATDPSESTRVLSIECIAELLPAFAEPCLLKIDTDGFDGRILSGAYSFIQRTHPILFWEFDAALDASSGGPGSDIFPMLENAGYRQLAVYTNVGSYVTTVPMDKHDTVSDLLSFFTARTPYPYADLCAFPEEDIDIVEALRMDELTNASQLRDMSRSKAR